MDTKLQLTFTALASLAKKCSFSLEKNADFAVRKLIGHTVVCISLETRSIASQPSVAVGWVKIKIWSMAQLKGLTAKFKLM